MTTRTPRGHQLVPVPVPPAKAFAVEHYQALAAAVLWEKHGADILSALRVAVYELGNLPDSAKTPQRENLRREIAKLVAEIEYP